MLSNKKKVIAVIGATGHQGGAVLRALQAGGQFQVRALTRNPGKHRDLALEVVEADLNRPDTLQPAFAGAHGVFLVTSFWQEGTDEFTQGTAAVRAAKAAGVEHFIWSTLPHVESDRRRSIRRSPLYWQGEGRSRGHGSGVCESYLRHRAVLLPDPRRRHGSATAG